jgi:hypothetical protein
MDMRFYWIQDQIDQSQYIVRWAPGATNKADYYITYDLMYSLNNCICLRISNSYRFTFDSIILFDHLLEIFSNELTKPYPSNIKEATPQILYTLWNFSVRNSNRRPYIQCLYMYHLTTSSMGMPWISPCRWIHKCDSRIFCTMRW